MSQNTPINPNTEVQSIDNLDTFFALLTAWHKTKVAMLKHMAEVPDGTQVILDAAITPIFNLEGDTLAAFRLGIELSLMELGTLPFYEEPSVAVTA